MPAKLSELPHAGNRLWILGTIIILFAVACSKAPENPAWFQSTATGEALGDNTLIAKINSIADLFTIYRMKEAYQRRGGSSDTVKRAVEERWDKLVAERHPLGSLCPEVDLIAFDYQKTGGDRYRAEYIIKVNKPFKTDLRISLYGAVAPENLNRISQTRLLTGKKSEVWTVKPSPPTSEWEPGEHILISQTFRASAIPYNMSVILFDPTRQPGQYGDKIQLGWRRGMTESILLKSINRADNLIDLYRLKGDCENFPSVRAAFKERSAKLLEENPSLGKICDEADLLAFNYSQIGENRYRVDYLFQVNTPLDKDCLITLYGVVDKNHLDRLSEARRQQGKKGEAWSFRPNPPTRNWPAGEYVLISDEIEAQPIPYNMHTILYDREGRRRYGNQVSLGWRVDLGGSESKRE